MKPIKTPEQHAEALACLDALVSRGEALTSEQQDKLEVLATLIEKYERDAYPLAAPTPVEAIRFRMEQMGYKQKDLAPLVGGASRASEIMTGKRGLTTEMILRLRDEWGIPSDSLLGSKPPEPDPSAPEPGAGGARDPENYPMKQMFHRGYFPGLPGEWKDLRKKSAALLQDLYSRVPVVRRELVHCRQGGGAKSKINPHALEAWQQRVLVRAAVEKQDLPAYDKDALDGNFLRWLAGLSCLPEGPRLAFEALEEKGIAMIIEARLDQTHLDGAALLTSDGRPVIGLTLRHDRLDNFWFTLFHEIGHVLRHLSPATPALFDSEIDQKKSDQIETEADGFALDTLIPPETWTHLRTLHFAAEIRAAAGQLRVHPAVIAGRLRREANDYRKHRTLIGSRKARAALGFTEESWPK